LRFLVRRGSGARNVPGGQIVIRREYGERARHTNSADHFAIHAPPPEIMVKSPGE
jgi:hypothetical protein